MRLAWLLLARLFTKAAHAASSQRVESCPVAVMQQLSRTRCVLGSTYGCMRRGRLWIAEGCRARFKCMAGSLDRTVNCGNYRIKEMTCHSPCGNKSEAIADDDEPRTCLGKTCLTQAALGAMCPRSRAQKMPKVLDGVPPMLYVDVGAHDGAEAISYAGHGHTVIAFEPTPSKVKHIRERLNRLAPDVRHRVTLHDQALSDQPGWGTFRLHGSNGGSERNALTQQGSMKMSADDAAAVRVQLATLDTALAGRSPFLLKIDAQGHDAQVLRGAEQLLRSKRIFMLLFEMSPRLAAGGVASCIEVVDWVQSLGYSCFDCPNCYPFGPFGQCGGVGIPATPLGGNATASRFRALASWPFAIKGVDHGWWTDVVCTPTASWETHR